MNNTSLSLNELNTASHERVESALAGLYEHSPWIVENALRVRPFVSLHHFKHALIEVVRKASRQQQIELVRAHPELAGKALISQTLTAESSDEQSRAGLAHCSPDEFARIQQLNRDYNAKFGWPFILAVRGPHGRGLHRQQIIDTFERRMQYPPDLELAECTRNIHRIAELRLNDKMGASIALGERILDWADELAVHSDEEPAPGRPLTVTYLTAAHQACARDLQQWMRECGFDEVHQDAVGNVVGLYQGTDPDAPRLLTGSHFDTVRDAGRYDGRLGVLVPMACVQQLHRQRQRLPFGIEVVAFAEEEGQRYKATFLGSSALTGQFNPSWLAQQDADGITMAQAMKDAHLPGDMAAIAACERDFSRYLGFVEVHIEQGPVLCEQDMPLGIVTSINASVRYVGTLRGMACHAGTTPMAGRHDAACGVAELALEVERIAAAGHHTVGTVGKIHVPSGSINVVPGACEFSLDLRAPSDAARDALANEVLLALDRICQKRSLVLQLEKTMTAAAAPSQPGLQTHWEQAVRCLGLPVFHLPSGAGHDAMKLHERLPQAMLFVRGLNFGISHYPLEAITADDAELAALAFSNLLQQLAHTP
jgi:beta-ureidopropionase / N-carbamoyl-L-amino-acid hydrolase